MVGAEFPESLAMREGEVVWDMETFSLEGEESYLRRKIAFQRFPSIARPGHYVIAR